MADSKPAANRDRPASPNPPKSLAPTATVSQVQGSIETSQPGVAQAASANSGSASPPNRFGRYRIDRELGRGAMGVVYLAEDTTIGRKVALKIPKAAVLEEPEALERFYREAKTTGLLRHPNICPVFDVGCIDGMHYLTMAYIPGKPVSSFLGKGKLPAVKQVALLIRKIALALEEAHRNGVVHRDLKPSNVMLDDRNEPIVMDFGLACQVNTERNARLTQSGAILGTPAYMAPEQVAGELDQIGPSSDIYALGVMLYQLLTGALPFTGPILAVFAQVLRDQPKRPAELQPDVDPALEAICLKMMAKKPAERYASMREAAAALTEYLKTGTIAGLEATVTLATGTEEASEVVAEPLEEFPDAAQRSRTLRKKADGKAKEPAPASTWARLRQQRWFWPAAGGLASLPVLALLAVVLVLRNNSVEVQIKIDDPMAVLKVDGKVVDIGGDGIGKIRLTVKEHSYTIERNDEVIEGPQAFVVTKNGSRLFDLTQRELNSPAIDYAAERALAELVLDLGGEVAVMTDVSDGDYFRDRVRLPRDNFRVSGAVLNQTYDASAQESRKRTESLPEKIWPLLKKCRCARLHLPHAKLTPGEIDHLAQLTSLRYLVAEDSGLTNADLQKLAGLKRLVGVILSRCPVDRTGLSALPIERLTGLGLEGTSIGDDGLRGIELSHMQYLNLNLTDVTDEVIERAINPDLSSLNVAHTRVTDRIFDRLDVAMGITMLDVRSAQISSEKARAFSKAHPSCLVYCLENGVDAVLRGGVNQGIAVPPLLKSQPATQVPLAPTVDNPSPPAGVGQSASLATALPAIRPVNYAAEREAAQWLFDHDVYFQVLLFNQQTAIVNKGEGIPRGEFQILRVNFRLSLPARAGDNPVSKSTLDMPMQAWRLLNQTQMSWLTPPMQPLTDDALDHLNQCTSLTFLDLSRTQLMNEGLARLSSLKQLRTLYLNNSLIDGRGLAHLRAFPRLDSLFLERTNLVDDDMPTLAALPITRVDLMSIPITDAGLKTLCSRPWKSLYLRGTRITDDGLAYLADCKVDHLLLINTRITDRGIDLLGPKPHFVCLYVQQTAVTEKRLQRFAADHPDIEIEFGAEYSGKVLNRRTPSDTRPHPAAPASGDDAAAAQAQVEIINRLTAKGFQFTVEIDRQWQQVTQTLTLPEQFDEFRVLTAATWQNNQATEQDFDELRGFPDLQEIGLNYFPVSADLLGRLAQQHPRLPSLVIGTLDTNVEQAASISGFRELRTLTINKCPKLTAKGVQAWASLTKLQSLTLRESPITDRDLEQFPQWPELTTLSLYYSAIEGRSVQELPAKYPKLSNLDLFNCRLVGSQVAGLEKLPLEELKLNLGATPDMRLDHLPPLPRLKKLMFTVNGRLAQQNKSVPHFTEFRPAEIVWLNSCPELHELEVWALSDRQVSQLSALQSVRKLIISGTGDLSPQTLETLRALPKLEQLYLILCNINDTHAPVLAKFDKLAGLMLLESRLTPAGTQLIRDGLPKCQIGITPATIAPTPPAASTPPAETKPPKPKSKSANNKKAAAGNPNHRAAEYVLSIGGIIKLLNDPREYKTVDDLPRQPFFIGAAWFRDNQQVTDKGLKAFQGCKNLTHLDLVRTKVTDAGLANFHDCKNLGILDLVSAPIGDEGLLGFKGSKGIVSLC